MDSYPERIDSRFRYVLLSARRAEQLMRGAQTRLEGDLQKPTSVAMEEIKTEIIDWDYGPAPEPVMDDEEYDMMDESPFGDDDME